MKRHSGIAHGSWLALFALADRRGHCVLTESSIALGAAAVKQKTRHTSRCDSPAASIRMDYDERGPGAR